MSDRMALPYAEMPRNFRLAIKNLKKPRRGRKRYSDASLKNTIQAVGQYLVAAQKAGLELELSLEGLAAFVQNLDARKLRSSTRLTYLTGVQAIAKELKFSPAKRSLLLEDCEIYREEMLAQVPTKVRKLTANPITLRDVASAALKWRREAQLMNASNKRRTYFQRSAVLAFLSLTPLRIKDTTGLIIGEHVFRSEQGWVLNLSSSKSGYPHNGTLHHSLTRFLDDLLLYGEGGSAILAYKQRFGTTLFANEMNEVLSPRTLAYNFKVATGHSPNIVRTLTHDALASKGTYGTDLARVLCGQKSIEVVKFYEVNAAHYRATQAQIVIRDIQRQILPRI